MMKCKVTIKAADGVRVYIVDDATSHNNAAGRAVRMMRMQAGEIEIHEIRVSTI